MLLTHLLIEFQDKIFRGRAGCLNDGGIHQSALGHHDACFGQPAIDGLEQLTGQLMLLEQVAEIHDGGPIRQGAIQG